MYLFGYFSLPILLFYSYEPYKVGCGEEVPLRLPRQPGRILERGKGKRA
jgi:hypothetical protein